ncbi:MAG: enoyl-CoA hydratase [Actinomycetia bacterium]|nr:enoyl-CoA hydratase [Actinomycetes bacterium]MCP4226031.1 enoyl-CoA hydratase [Actinomycetes bacterium]MCP5035709.1 enoyl-CoA hydratase [Actinomycetes bacterium]
MTVLETGTDDLLAHTKGRVAVLTFNRPEARNALSSSMYEGFARVLPTIAADPDIGCVMVTGAGGAFSAGGDVKAMATRGAPGSKTGPTVEGRVDGLRRRQELVSLALHELPKPVVGAIPGPAAGAGLSIALACDVRIMADSAFLTTAFANVGFSGDFGGSWFLSQLVGTAMARELYFTARRVTSGEALSLGLTNRVVPAESFEADALAFAEELASGPPIAHRLMKENLNRALHHDLRECLDAEAVGMTRTGQTEDHKEAAKAFVEGRRPEFKGR